jgi:intracellular sulfur oxidation DsrE/DsrF family protein
LQSEKPAGGFYTLHHEVDGYAREEEIVLVIMGEGVDVFVSSNMETSISENSRLCDMVLNFLVALM